MSAKRSQELFEVFREAARQKKDDTVKRPPAPEKVKEYGSLNVPKPAAESETGVIHCLNITYEQAITGLLVIIALLVMSYVVGHKVGHSKGSRESIQESPKNLPPKTPAPSEVRE